MKKLLAFGLLLFSQQSLAAASCSEKLTHVITHSNGEIYFKTSKTCTQGWCQLKWSSQEQKSRTYGAMLTAKTADKAMDFYWSTVNSCEQENATYASPDYVTY